MKAVRHQDLELTAYHGGQQENPRWFTTDRDHARSFGEVREYRIRLRTALEIDMSHPILRDEDGNELSGYEADDALYQYLDAEYVDGIIVHGWEGLGVCILVSHRAEVELVAD